MAYQNSIYLPLFSLVGGSTPSEKYESRWDWDIIPNIIYGKS